MKLAMGCDPAAYRFYKKLLERMKEEGYDIVDTGCESENEADGGKYAEIAEIVSNKVVSKECDYGILICGTGQGMAMAANKIPGIRAVLCYDVFPAVLSKNDNNGNVLCTGAWFMESPAYHEYAGL
ncbi:MAG: RpiB/LacA/LacB family sugar-phosphate isomerase [Agathobacter rectalis]